MHYLDASRYIHLSGLCQDMYNVNYEMHGFECHFVWLTYNHDQYFFVNVYQRV